MVSHGYLAGGGGGGGGGHHAGYNAYSGGDCVGQLSQEVICFIQDGQA